MTAVYFLYHIDYNDVGRYHNGKLIGVYSTAERAQQTIEQLSDQPGFRDYPERWKIHRRTLDRDSWAEGFVAETDERIRSGPEMEDAREREMIEEIADSFVGRSIKDSFGLFEIPLNYLRRRYGITDDEEILRLTLAVVLALLARGKRPGYFGNPDFDFWKETDGARIVARIRREWEADGEPTLGHPICWFD